MRAEQQFKVRYYRTVFIFVFFVSVVAVFLCSGQLFAGQRDANRSDSSPARYRVFTLRDIPAKKAIKLLEELEIGTASKLGGTNAILVTAQAKQLIKAGAILKLVDSEAEFAIKTIRLVPTDGNTPSLLAGIPSRDKIAAELGGDISIGTFSQPPDRDAASKAIVDVHRGAVVVVAEKSRLEKIISAVERAGTVQNDVKTPLPLQGKESPVSAEPNEPAGSEADAIAVDQLLETWVYEQIEDESNELFGKLIDSLADAEKKAAQSQSQQQVPDSIAQPQEPEPQPTPVTVEPEKPIEPVEVAAETEEKLAEPVEAAVEAEKLAEPVEVAAKTEEKPAEPVEVTAKTEEKPAEPVSKISYQPEPIIDGNEMLELDLPEQLEIGDLLRLVGEYLQLDYMYDPAKIKGSVTLKLRGPIKVRDLYPLLESVLKFRDFVMTRKGNLVTIVPAAEVLQIDPVLLDADKGRVEVGDIIVTRIFKLNYVDTDSAKNLLTGMKLGVNVTPIEATGTLIVSGYAYRMKRIEELLAMIDKPGEPRQFRFRQLKYTMAETLAPKIKSLVEQLGTISITVAKPSAAPAPKPARGRPAPRARTPAAPKPTGPTTKPAVYLDSDERTNRILMIGLEKELAVVDELIDTLDIAQQDLRTLRVYDIQHVGAEEVQEKLAELGITGAAPKTATSSRIRRPATEKSARPTPSAATTESPLEDQPQVVIIEATNSLLVNGTAEQHIRIATIISYVDSETLTETIPYKVYSLENQDPVAMAEVLNKLIQETTKDKDGKIERTTKITEDDIVIVPDENTFSIIVYASKKDQKWVENLIKNLDKRRPQVLIDVSLVEITRSEDFEYDLSIIANARNLVTSNIGVKGAGLPLSAGYSTILEGGFNLTDSDGKKTKRVQGFYNDDRIQAILTLIDSKSYGRVLAKPKILVNDNEEGVIRTTQKIHIGEVTQTWRGEVSPTSTETTTWKPYEAKIELTITPHISEGSLLRLEIAMLREDFTEKDLKPPDYTTSDIDTIVTVPDGSTIILGGLTKLNQSKGGSKVPLLGDIPIFGALFRSVDNSDTGSKLYIFVKANILRPDETVAGLAQLQEISNTNRAAFERDEFKFQSHQSIPGIEPELMEPEKVLEEGFEESG